MAAEIERRGMVRPITDLPSTLDPTSGYVEIEIGGHFYSVNQGYLGGGDPALQPIGTELADYSTEFTSAPSFLSWINQGTSTVNLWQSRAVIVPQAGGAGTNNLRLYGFGPPTAPWAMRVRMLNWSPVAGQGGGLFAYNSANGRIYAAQVYLRASISGGTMFSETWGGNEYSNFSTINSSPFAAANENERSRDRFLQLRSDGTTLYWDFSADNAQFQNVTSRTIATYLGGITAIGVVGNDPTVGTPAALVGYDWIRTYGNANLNQGP